MFMKRGLIGVWFSVARVIFGLSVWGGFRAGSGFARCQYFRRQRAIEKTYSPGRRLLESEQIEFRSLEYAQFLIRSTQMDTKVERQYLLAVIPALEKHAQQPGNETIKQVIEFNLGLVYVEAALAEEKDGNKDPAESDMKSAQSIFQSLGWKDYSEDALRVFAQNQLDQWKSLEMSPEK